MGDKLKTRLRPGLRGLKQRAFRNIRKTSPLLVLRILATTLVFLPWLAFALICSWMKMLHWRKVRVCQAFMRRHTLAFRQVDIDSLEVFSVSGGVSNSNQIWECRTSEGRSIRYFVKIFVSAGSFWAKHLSLVSPFPEVYGGRTHERFTVDMISRVQLEERGIPVPKLLAYDAVEKVMVTEFLQGENVDDVLKRIARKGVTPEDREVIHQSGFRLAEVHSAGFSLIDTQPVNCIWVAEEKRVYFTDLEFCTREDKQAWDVGFFVCFIALRLPAELKKEARDAFMEGYEMKRPLEASDIAEITQALKEYLPIFETILDIRQFTPEELFEELLSS